VTDAVDGNERRVVGLVRDGTTLTGELGVRLGMLRTVGVLAGAAVRVGSGDTGLAAWPLRVGALIGDRDVVPVGARSRVRSLGSRRMVGERVLSLAPDPMIEPGGTRAEK
jgi:hypothetical protein